MKIAITGASGFLGKNLVPALETMNDVDVVTVSHRQFPAAFAELAADCDFVYYLAAVHRPDVDTEYERVNHQLFRDFLKVLRLHDNACPVVFTSSVQATLDNPYGRSKRRAEEALEEHCAIGRSPGLIFRLPNLFGPHAKPHSHSVVATFCYNAARGVPLDVHDPARTLTLCYVGDIVELLWPLARSSTQPSGCRSLGVPDNLLYRLTLAELADAVRSCGEDDSFSAPHPFSERFLERLCSTYRSYVPSDGPFSN